MRTRGRRSEQVDEALLDGIGDDVLPAAGLVVDLLPLQADDLGQQQLGQTVLAHDAGRQVAPVVGQLQGPVGGDTHQSVVLQAGHGLGHGGGGQAQALDEAGPDGRDALFLQLPDRAKVHLRGVDQRRRHLVSLLAADSLDPVRDPLTGVSRLAGPDTAEPWRC